MGCLAARRLLDDLVIVDDKLYRHMAIASCARPLLAERPEAWHDGRRGQGTGGNSAAVPPAARSMACRAVASPRPRPPFTTAHGALPASATALYGTLASTRSRRRHPPRRIGRISRRAPRGLHGFNTVGQTPSAVTCTPPLETSCRPP